MGKRCLKESNQTALAFAGNKAAEMNGLAISPNDPGGVAGGWEVCSATDDVTAADDHALTEGCVSVVEPCEKPWGRQYPTCET